MLRIEKDINVLGMLMECVKLITIVVVKKIVNLVVVSVRTGVEKTFSMIIFNVAYKMLKFSFYILESIYICTCIGVFTYIQLYILVIVGKERFFFYSSKNKFRNFDLFA